MKVNSVLDLIGNTPLVKLERIIDKEYANEYANIYAKIESMNLTGSMKARSALGMIKAAEERGELKPGYTIIESTSGNLGYALAAIGKLKGYDVIVVIDPKTDELKRNILKAYGAKLVIVKKADERGAYQPARIKKVQQLLKKIPNSWCPMQYESIDNLMAHYKTTGPEIYEEMEGKIDVLIGAVGTCGHLGGSAKYLKEKIPNLRVIGVEPDGSVLSGGEYHPYLVQGPGLSFIPKNLDRNVIEKIVKVSDEDAFYTARKLAKTEALLMGGSSGAVVHTALKVAKEIGPGKNIVTILGDDGFRYAMNFYDDNWLVTHKIQPPE